MERTNGSFDKWGGEIASNAEEFVDHAVHLYENEERWNEAQRNGTEILCERFDKASNSLAFEKQILSLIGGIAAIRSRNVLGSILWSSGHQYTKYFAKFIGESLCPSLHSSFLDLLIS